MSDWKEFRLQLNFGGNSANITWSKSPEFVISIHGLPFDRPGEQTESQSQEAVRRAAKQALQELIDQL